MNLQNCINNAITETNCTSTLIKAFILCKFKCLMKNTYDRASKMGTKRKSEGLRNIHIGQTIYCEDVGEIHTQNQMICCKTKEQVIKFTAHLL